MTDETTILIRDLIAAGVEASLIARISVLAVRVADLDRRRAADADRQRRRRSRMSQTSRDVSDVTPRAYTSPQEPYSKPKRVSHTGRELPNDWTADREFARAKGWSESKISEEAARFRDHAKAKGRKAKDWDAAWRNWVTSPYQGAGNGQRSRTALQQAGDDLIARLESAEREDGLIIDHDPG